MKTKAQKQDIVTEIKSAFEASSSLIIVHYRGLSVAQISDLRDQARENNSNVYVTKNRLAKIAANDTKFSNVVDLFAGPTAMIYSEDEVSAAKVVAKFAKDNEVVEIIGGAVGETKLDKAGVESLAKMPSLDESRAKLVGLLQAPAQKLASVSQAPAGQLARVFGAYGGSGS